MFANYWKPHTTCSHCGLPFAREAGFFLGAIYINYGLTALILAIAYPLLLFNAAFTERELLVGGLIFAVCFPLWFFRYARAFWAAFDQYWDPRDA